MSRIEHRIEMWGFLMIANIFASSTTDKTPVMFVCIALAFVAAIYHSYKSSRCED